MMRLCTPVASGRSDGTSNVLGEETARMDTNVENAVRRRYEAGAKQKQAALCCPVQYDHRYLEVIPAEVIEKDYGCGDPSRYLRAGETVLDLGSDKDVPAEMQRDPNCGAAASAARCAKICS